MDPVQHVGGACNVTCCFTVQCVANAFCMDDLDRLVSVDAAETHAASSASGGGAAAVAGPQADPGSKNGQYRLFAMVSHLGKNTTSGAWPPAPPESSQRAELLPPPPAPSLTRHRPLRCAHHERRPVAALQRREGAASSRPPSHIPLTTCPPCTGCQFSQAAHPVRVRVCTRCSPSP